MSYRLHLFPANGHLKLRSPAARVKDKSSPVAQRLPAERKAATAASLL
jgi:hypothetical protein